MPEWLIYHFDENLQPVGSHKPTIHQLEWDIETGISIQYEIALSDPFLRRDVVAPKRTTWELHNYGNLVDAGIHSNRNLRTGRDSVVISGKSYLWWLDNVIYPFDPRPGMVRPYQPFRQSQWTGVTRKSIVQDLVLAVQQNQVPNPNTATGFLGASYAYMIGVIGDSGGVTNYAFDFADQRSILQHIRDLADAEDGFDWRFNPVAFSFEIGSPSFDNGNDLFTFDYEQATPNPLIDVEWDDDGPEATVTYGLGAGTQNRQFGWISTYEPSLQTYHKWDKVEDLGEVKNFIELKTQTASRGFLQRFPMKRISIVVDADPNILPGFWTGNMPRQLIGRRVHVRQDFSPYHLIDSSYIITKLSLDCKTSGDVIATMTGDIVNT